MEHPDQRESVAFSVALMWLSKLNSERILYFGEDAVRARGKMHAIERSRGLTYARMQIEIQNIDCYQTCSLNLLRRLKGFYYRSSSGRTESRGKLFDYITSWPKSIVFTEYPLSDSVDRSSPAPIVLCHLPEAKFQLTYLSSTLSSPIVLDRRQLLEDDQGARDHCSKVHYPCWRNVAYIVVSVHILCTTQNYVE